MSDFEVFILSCSPRPAAILKAEWTLGKRLPGVESHRGAIEETIWEEKERGPGNEVLTYPGRKAGKSQGKA